MFNRFRLATTFGLFLCAVQCYSQSVTMSADVLFDKIKGGWVGKAYGVSYGGPTEFTSLGRIIEDTIHLSEQSLKRLSKQDDLFVNMAFLSVLARKGLHAPTASFAEELVEGSYLLWHGNGQARQNILEGTSAELAGHPLYNPHADDIDFQIESDFIGLTNPGMPHAAQGLAKRVGHIVGFGEGFYGGVFVSSMYTAAFYKDSVRSIIESGLKTLPPASRYASIVRDVIQWYEEDPSDWRITWSKIETKWNTDRCPWGAKSKFNIGAHVNGAYVVLALLFGGGDIVKTVDIATRCGQDSDCNPSTAAGILGTLYGYSKFPQGIKTELGPYLSIPLASTGYSIESASQECVQLAIESVRAEGGSNKGSDISILLQPYVVETELENSFPTLEPVRRFEATDSRLEWVGSWQLRPDAEEPMMSSSVEGDCLNLDFEGTAVYVQGDIHHDKGILEFLIDGKKIGERDMYLDKKWRNAKQSKAVWITGLPPAHHTLQVRVAGRKREASEGTEISLGRVVVYRGDISHL